MRNGGSSSSWTIFTLGHSTRPMEEFLFLLQAHQVKCVFDIRSIPGSSHCPQFNQESLKASLKRARIGYRHFKDLGGRRSAVKDSKNTGWKKASFRNFADYMQTPAFKRGLEKLEKAAFTKRCALMCAEALPWRCHRSLVADALVVRGWQVLHIFSAKVAKEHQRTSFLKVSRGKLSYPEPFGAPSTPPKKNSGPKINREK